MGLDSAVQWTFAKTTSSTRRVVFSNGVLPDGFVGRFYVNTSTVGGYTLVIDGIEVDDAGVYRCTDDSGRGLDDYLIHVEVQTSKNRIPMSDLVPPQL
jgi:hypothetical protein